jgi:hypothetical protein
MQTEQSPLREEAETCRRRALTYIGQPEATFLIKAAKAFDELADAEAHSRRATLRTALDADAPNA